MPSHELDSLLEIMYYAYCEGPCLYKTYNQAQRVFIAGILQGLITGSADHILDPERMLRADVTQNVRNLVFIPVSVILSDYTQRISKSRFDFEWRAPGA